MPEPKVRVEILCCEIERHDCLYYLKDHPEVAGEAPGPALKNLNKKIRILSEAQHVCLSRQARAMFRQEPAASSWKT